MISIITPVFNGIRFIEFCINNVIEQNCPGLEHIIVDGGSTDGTVKVIENYAQRYKHIRWISEKDRGQSDAMNKGIVMAMGDILGFLPADDYYETGALSVALNIIKDLPDPSLLVANCNVWDNDGKLWFVSKPKNINLRNLLLGRFMEAFPMNPSAYIYHKSLHDRIGIYEVDEHYGMDVHFIFKAVQKAHVTYLDKTLGNYRYLEGTKTFEDDKSGGNKSRVKRIIGYYLKQQPLYYRLYIATLKKWMSFISLSKTCRMRRVRSFICSGMKSFTARHRS